MTTSLLNICIYIKQIVRINVLHLYDTFKYLKQINFILLYISIYYYILLTTCTRDHHVAVIMSVFIETRDEQSHVNEDEY